MNNKITISLTGIIAVTISLFLGYLWGRSSVEFPAPKRIVEIRYKKGKIVRDTIHEPVPYEIEVKIPDTIEVPVYTDTAALFAIWKDYHSKRKYNLDFSNDSLGTFKVDAVVSQNKIISSTSEIIPIIRTEHEKEVIYKVPMIQPWASIGSSIDLRTNKVQFGLDLRNKYIIGVSGIRMLDKYGYTIDFGVKF